jgi:hypothetical protein
VGAGGGGLLIADNNNVRIRFVALPSGEVSTLMGTGVQAYADGFVSSGAAMGLPRALCSDAAGGAMFGDQTYKVIRWLSCPGASPSTSRTPTPSPSPSPGASPTGTPTGTATQTPSMTTVFGCMVSTLAGSFGAPGAADGVGAAALLNQPSSLTLDPAANLLFVVARGSHSVRALDAATGSVTTLAGGGAAGFANGVGTAAAFNAPRGAELDAAGARLFVADGGNNRIRAVYLPTRSVSTFAGSGVAGSVDGAAGAAQFRTPAGLCLAATSQLLVVDSGNHQLRAVSPAGAVTTLAGSPAAAAGFADGVGTNARFSGPTAIAASPADPALFFVSDTANHRIRSFSTATLAVALVAGSGAAGQADNAAPALASFWSPAELKVDAAGAQLLVGDAGSNRVRALSLASGAVSTLAGTGATGGSNGAAIFASFSAPTGIAVSASIGAFVADAGGHTVRRIVCPSSSPSATPTGTPSTGATSSSSPTRKWTRGFFLPMRSERRFSSRARPPPRAPIAWKISSRSVPLPPLPLPFVPNLILQFASITRILYAISW